MTVGVYSIYGSLERAEYGTEKGQYGHTRQLYKKGQEMDSGAVLRSLILKLQALHLGSTDAEILCLLIEHYPMQHRHNAIELRRRGSQSSRDTRRGRVDVATNESMKGLWKGQSACLTLFRTWMMPSPQTKCGCEIAHTMGQ